VNPAILLALYLHAPVGLVTVIYDTSGLDGVALVWCESRFNPRALRREPRGHTSFGLFQLDDEYHKQYRGNLTAHIAEGERFLEECKGGRERHSTVSPAGGRSGGHAPSLSLAVARYNGSLAWGLIVEAKRDELARWLAWRWVKDEEIAWTSCSSSKR